MSKRKRPIRLCFVMPGTYQLFNSETSKAHGGAELNLYYLSKLFAKDSRYEVSFIVEDQGQQHIEYYDNVKVIRLTGLRWNNKPRKLLGKLWSKIVIEFATAYEMLHAKYDIVLVTTASVVVTRMVFWGQCLGRKQVVFRFANDTDADPHYFEKTEHNKLKDRFYWWGVKHSKELVFQTKQQEEIFQRYEKRDGNLIGNGFIIKEAPPDVVKDSILWVSRSNEVKRPHLFLELARRLPTEKFIMIIPGQNELKDTVVEQAKELPNVTIYNYIPFEEINYYFEHAKLFVSTSTYEGFPNTFIQCGMARTPVLSFCINPDNIINEYMFGYVCEDSIDAAVEFIQKLNDDVIQNYGQNIRQYTLAEHDIINTFHKYEKLFNYMILKEGYEDVKI